MAADPIVYDFLFVSEISQVGSDDWTEFRVGRVRLRRTRAAQRQEEKQKNGASDGEGCHYELGPKLNCYYSVELHGL